MIPRENFLPIIKIAGKNYFIDKRLSQIREVNNPHNYEPVSLELINYWIDHNVQDTADYIKSRGKKGGLNALSRRSLGAGEKKLY